MKKFILLLALGTLWNAKAESQNFATDTVVYIDNKKVEITETDDRTRVKVYERTEEDGYVELEKVFEGHYRNGQSHEKRRYPKSINIPLPTWHTEEFDGHWEGFGIGFANFADSKLHINDVDGVTLRSGNSMEYNLNLLSYSIPIKRTNLGIVTGMGMRWNRYRVDNGQYFKQVDGITTLLTLPEGQEMKTSKLNTTSLTIPLLLEWQPCKHTDYNPFFSVGIIGVFKTISSSKIVYYNEEGARVKQKVDGGMNIHPVTVDFLVQAGIKWFGLYAKYSPVKLFEHGKGPNVHPVSLGLQLYW